MLSEGPMEFVIGVKSEGAEDTHNALVVTVVTAARDMAVDTEAEEGGQRAEMW